MFSKFFFIEMTAIQPHMFSTCSFHFTIYCSCYNIPWRKILSFIISFHKCFAILIAKNSTIATNRFRN